MIRHFHPVFTLCLTVALSLALSGCPAPPRPAAPPTTPRAAELRPVPGARLYTVAPEQSLVRILAYRGGALTQAGHNHVIASHALNGRLYLHPELNKSAFELILPVDSLTVDEPALRREEGSEFPPEVPESARQGTRKNMLSEALLNGARYPAIKLVSTSISGAPEQLGVTVQINLKDQLRTLSVPLVLQENGGRLTANGEFKVKQTDLGLTPFSVLMGALQVRDELLVKFNIVALAAGR